MGWLFFVIFMFIIIPIALGKLLLDNIVSIFLIALFVIIFLICLVKKPGVTIIATIVLAIIVLIGYSIDKSNQLNKSPVTIYVATGTSSIYDYEGNQHKIPQGAIVAQHGSTYSWYYNHTLSSIDVDTIRNLTYKTTSLQNQWALTAMDEITYKEYKKSEWWLDFSDEAQKYIAIAEADTQALAELYAHLDSHPFEQQYWVIFTEGFRDDRIELSTVNSDVNRSNLHIVWKEQLVLNDTSDQSECTQFYLDENGQWIQIGTYPRLSDNATRIIASNLDVYDGFGNLVIEKTSYTDLDWSLLNFG